jgi:ABC-type transport system involved in multi-copper enzyme maturation permease subunit
MLAGPIFSLETVTTARRARYFVVRVLYAAALLVALCGAYSIWSRSVGEPSVRDVAEFGAAFFTSFAVLQLLMVAGLGPGLAAGTIAQERERRTIEYLFATDLSNSEIVLGKLAARLLLLLYLVLAGLPILSLAMLLGGISPTRLALVFLITASSMLMITGLSIAISVWSPRAREAVMRTYVVLLALLLLPPLATLVSFYIPAALNAVLNPLVAAGLLVNPFWKLAWLGPVDPVGLWGVWLTAWPLVAGQLGIAAASLAAALWGVRRVHLKHSSAAKKSLAWPRLWRPPIEPYPMLYKELFAERAVPQLGWFAPLVMLLVAAGFLTATVVMFVNSAGSREFQHFAVVIGAATSTAALLAMAARAAGSVTSEKERDTWTTILSTPLTAGEIVAAKVLGNLYAARLAYGLLAILWTLAIWREPVLVFGAAASAAILLLGAVCVSLIGLLFSASCSTSQRAMGWTLAVIVFLGGGYLAVCLPLMAPTGEPDGIILAACPPFLLTFPGMVVLEGVPRGEEGIVAAFLLGVPGYFFLTLFLWRTAVTKFDQMAGRRGGDVGVRGSLNRLARPRLRSFD